MMKSEVTEHVTGDWALAIHGGAGPKPGRDYSVVESHLRTLLVEGRKRLESGESALDVCEILVRAMEASGYYVAGKGSPKNRADYVELDAAIMDGRRRVAGGVAGLRDIVHPISAARCVLRDTPHVLLVGVGAMTFARDAGLEIVSDPDSYYGPAIGVSLEEQAPEGVGHGTVGAVARDLTGALAAATSTGGVFGKLEGRVGDSPLIGAGTWADDEVAISCTGTGEYFILAGGARDVSARIRYQGLSLDQAAQAFLDEVARLGGNGGLIAVDKTGQVSLAFNTSGMKRGSVSSSKAIHVATFGEIASSV